MKDHYGLFVGVSVVLLGIQVAIQLVNTVVTALTGFPLIGLLAAFLLIPHLTAGQLYVGIKAFRGQQPTFDDFLAGFRRYGTVAGAFFLVALVSFGCAIAAGLAVALSVFAGVALREPVVAGILIGGGILLSIVLMIYIAMRFFFVLQFAVDGKNLGVMDCFYESSRITEGRKLHLFAFAVVVGLLVALTGVCGCVIGAILLGYPLQMGALAAAYCLLCRESG